LRAPFLNQPIGDINATTEWTPAVRRITLQSAQAFGARWSGALESRDPVGDWQFTLAGDHLAAAELDRWLNPAWRESFLSRMLPFLNPRSPAGAAPENLRASGRLTLDQFTLAPLVVRHLQGDLKFEGRHIVLANATGQFYGGQVDGSLDANLSGTPAYRADLNFSRVDGAALVAATPALTGVTAKNVSGQISIATAGANRADLLASLTCQGSATAIFPKLLNVDVWQSRGPDLPVAKSTAFDSADSSFSCAQRKIEFQRLSLGIGVETSEVGTGTIAFNRDLDLHFQAHSDLVGHEVAPPPSFRLAGSLAAPTVVPAQPPLRLSR
jgi:AsmA-like C-terminal region